MKFNRGLVLIMFIAGIFLFSACTTINDKPNREVQAFAGLIDIQGNRLHITPSEVFVLYNDGEKYGFVRDRTTPSIIFIERNDTAGMAEHGLTLDDFMPSGYHMRLKPGGFDTIVLR